MTEAAQQLRGQEAEEALADLGVTAAILREAVEAGESDRRSRGPNDPPIVSGVVAWGSGIASLRTSLSRRGWRPDSYKGLPLVVNEDREVGITFALGNAHTGISGPVGTKHPKGAATADLVQVNQLTMFDGDIANAPPSRTYFLLYHRTATEIRVELSLPRSFTWNRSSVEITEWSQRIVLEPIQLVSESARRAEVERAAEAEVQISPRDEDA